MTDVKGKSPWRVGKSVFRTIYDADGNLIGVMDRPEDALLAAAAPGLLAALKRLLGEVHPEDVLADAAVLQAREAIEGAVYTP